MSETEIVSLVTSSAVALYVLAKEVVKWLQKRTDAEGTVATQAIRLAKKTREDTGAHVTRWAECEKRCRELAEQFGRVEERLEDALRENEGLRAELEASKARETAARERIRAVEEDVLRLRTQLGLFKSIDNIRRLKPAKEQ